jgi:hypothetical protein
MPAGAKVVSEKREKKTLVRVIFIAPNTGAVVPPLQIFFLERIDTPTGRMLIVTDDEQRRWIGKTTSNACISCCADTMAQKRFNCARC